ncbi:uncharacterized protein LOC126761404 isoform X2 [Bactrocera neohumeralis]|uniref:uncharacterized protein LOC126761404 isoform X2 n=1 Tax=Bactrocera neohumeralis TaxID=98809 RepID=UPI002165D935|nr:uncharacterized protein LOC126761404 isoform X2 [Bactrocera neohumeralis]
MHATDATTDCVRTQQQLGMLRRVARSLNGCQHENLSEKPTPSAYVNVPKENVCKTARHAIKKKVTSRQTVETTKLKMMHAINVVPQRGSWKRAIWPMTLLCWCFIIIVNAPANGLNYVDDTTASAELNTQAGARAMGLYGAREPRFGDRLLPLRKKSGAIANVAAPSQRQVNSILSKSNYVVSYASANTNNAATSAKVMARAANTNTTGEVNVARNNKVDVSVSVEPKTDLYTMEVHQADYTAPPVTAERRAKQLSRREDTNIAGLLLDSTTFSSKDTNISKADRLVVMSTEFFVVPTSTPLPSNAHPTRAPARTGAKAAVLPDYIQPPPAGVPTAGPRSVLIVAPRPLNTSNAANSVSAGFPPSIVPTHLPFTGLRKEPWVVPVLVLAALTMLMMTAFEIFVLFKAWRTSPSRRHLFLGQMLLLGLFACAGLGAVLTAQPSLLSCGAIRFGVGVAYALVFAALLVKCVFLISLNGGVYLPAPYQGLLLLFAVLIQVAIGTQWLLTQPPEIYTQSVPILGNSLLAPTVASSSATSAAHTFAALFQPHSATPNNGPSAAALGSSLGSDLYARITAAGTMLIPLCKTQFSELLFSLIYIVFLIVFVAVLAIKSRGIRDNYREATYIGLAIGGAIPIWLGWMLCGLAVADRHKDACIAFGLIATSATVFLVMFMPKGRQLAAMGKEGLYVEDREEQFSSLSRAGSGYSPSFFHFKPIKYGVMGGGMQNSATNTGNGASMKHCSNGLGGGGGDRVALVTAAPPSYTRMYHYFPAHLSAHPFCFYPQPPPPPPPPPIPPPTLTQLPSPPTLKQLGNSLSSMTQAHIAQTLRYPGLFIRPDETNLYTTLEPTLSSNPNVYFQRGGAVHPGMMY